MVQPGPDEALLAWMAAGGMALATLAFAVTGRREGDPRRREFYVLASFATAASFLGYVALATGFGVVEVAVAGERVAVHWGRFAGWLVALPSLLIALALLARADRATVGALVGLAVATVAAGLAAALATGGTAGRVGWWLVSATFWVALVAGLVGGLTRQASRRPDPVAATFAWLRNLVAAAWTVSLVVWILGPASTVGVLGPTVRTGLAAAVDLVATIGFGLVLLRDRSVLDLAVRSRGAHDAAAPGEAATAE